VGNDVGLVYYGTAPTTLQLGDTSFASALAAYIINSSPNGVDAASGATFGGVNTSTAPVVGNEATFFAIEDKIADAIDATGPGLVRLQNGHVFVTPNSFANLGTPPFTTTTPSIQRAINAASPGDTVHVQASTYTENLTINKNLTLVSDTGRGTATI